MTGLNGLTGINIELTSRCNKECHMCGRRKQDKEHPDIVKNYGDMDIELVERIAAFVPKGILVQFHWNGEPLLYKKLEYALSLFDNNIRALDTNGKLLEEKADEIIGNLDTIAISIIEGDTEEEQSRQKYNIREFLKKKGPSKPNVIFRVLGDVDIKWFKNKNGMIVHRALHAPEGSFNYSKKVVIPEIGICQEALTKIAIDRLGNVSPCVRFDPEGHNIIGNITRTTLHDIWYGPKRRKFVRKHIDGKRDDIALCSKCDYWGCPTC